MICLNVLLTAKNPIDVPAIRDLLAEAMRKSRAEPGCLRFDVYHSSAEPRRFTLVEHWASQEALDAHRLAEAYLQIYKPHVMPLVDREGHPSTLLE
jgi:quinol monooxygenase YgiN